jgi:hypothetical protein
MNFESNFEKKSKEDSKKAMQRKYASSNLFYYLSFSNLVYKILHFPLHTTFEQPHSTLEF